MAERQTISSGTKWEPIVGYSRVVRVGSLVYVAGTVASDESGEVIGKGDPYAQSRYILEKIAKYLETAGAGIQHVVRTRMFLTDADMWEEVTRAHAEFFADVRPVATLVEISRLIGTDYLVEIEVDAVIHEDL